MSSYIAFGCLPGIHPQRLQNEYGVIPIPRPRLAELDERIQATVPYDSLPDANLIGPAIERAQNCFSLADRIRVTYYPSLRLASRIAAAVLTGRQPKPASVEQGPTFNIRVAQGCNSQCSYCAIRFAVGPLTSKPLDIILSEFERGLEAGFRKYYLLADDVGAYGEDIGSSVLELLTTLLNHPGSFRISMHDVNPQWFVRYFDQLRELFVANAEKIGFVGIPVQSGSDRVLKLMRREYTKSDLTRCLTELRHHLPNLVMMTHVMVGFPGETDEDLAETIDLIRTARFNAWTVYSYDDRPGTPSASMPDQIPERVKHRRARQCRRAFRLALRDGQQC